MILDTKGNAEASGSSVYRVPTVDSPPAYHSSRSALIDDASDAEARSSSNEAKLALNRRRRRRRIILFVLAVIIYSAALIVFVVKVCILTILRHFSPRSAGWSGHPNHSRQTSFWTCRNPGRDTGRVLRSLRRCSPTPFRTYPPSSTMGMAGTHLLGATATTAVVRSTLVRLF